MAIENILQVLRRMPRSGILLLGGTLIVFIGLIDYLTGYQISLSLFYLLPIALVCWYVSKEHGIVFALFSILVWFDVNMADKGQEFNLSILIWNAIIRLGFFLIVVSLLGKLKIALEFEKKVSRTDYLTSVANSRFFYELAEMEIERAKRHNRMFSLAYMDVDNFKKVNDNFGHKTGDLLLQTIAETIKSLLRKTDLIARLAGDEFAILLAETDNDKALETIKRIKECLNVKVREKAWPVSFSFGLITNISNPGTLAEIINKADSLMYIAKKNGKNTIECKQYNQE
ncbi:MAG: GGDEF domain-containing protein [Candidatus Omnitrophica bacterium]|nr:GGDEF domain-containing protein [Candidatus Omnitrophota bacterium]